MLMKYQSGVAHWAAFTVPSEPLLFFQVGLFHRAVLAELNGCNILYIVVLTNKELLTAH